jgi:hypothetical protein
MWELMHKAAPSDEDKKLLAVRNRRYLVDPDSKLLDFMATTIVARSVQELDEV